MEANPLDGCRAFSYGTTNQTLNAAARSPLHRPRSPSEFRTTICRALFLVRTFWPPMKQCRPCLCSWASTGSHRLSTRLSLTSIRI